MDQSDLKMMRYLSIRGFQLLGEQGEDWLHIYEGERERRTRGMKKES